MYVFIFIIYGFMWNDLFVLYMVVIDLENININSLFQFKFKFILIVTSIIKTFSVHYLRNNLQTPYLWMVSEISNVWTMLFFYNKIIVFILFSGFIQTEDFIYKTHCILYEYTYIQYIFNIMLLLLSIIFILFL